MTKAECSLERSHSKEILLAQVRKLRIVGCYLESSRLSEMDAKKWSSRGGDLTQVRSSLLEQVLQHKKNEFLPKNLTQARQISKK